MCRGLLLQTSPLALLLLPRPRLSCSPLQRCWGASKFVCRRSNHASTHSELRSHAKDWTCSRAIRTVESEASGVDERAATDGDGPVIASSSCNAATS